MKMQNNEEYVVNSYIKNKLIKFHKIIIYVWVQNV